MSTKKVKLTDKEIAIRELKTKARQVIINTHYYLEKSHQNEFKTVLNWDKEQYTNFKNTIKELEDLILFFEFAYFEEYGDKMGYNLSDICQNIIDELETALSMLKNCEELFQNSQIIQKSYKLLKVNYTIFTRLQPFI